MTKLEWNLQEIFINNQSFYDEINNVKQLLEDVKKYKSAEEDYIKFLSAGSSQYSLDLLKILNKENH